MFSSFSIKEELSLEKLKGVKLWITAGPREKFTASEVMYYNFLQLFNYNYFPLFNLFSLYFS